MSWQAFGDWGTSHLRLYRIEAGQVTASSAGPGIGAIGEGGPASALRKALAQLGPDAPAEIRLCGMAGSRTGLAEAPYADCPADAAQWNRAAIRLTFDGVPLALAAGLACEDSSGCPDVMRGEETQIFGAIAVAPELGAGRSILVLPGTHSKWAVLENGTITSFRTFLSGELFALLKAHSTLLALGDSGASDEEQGFAEGLARVRAREGLSAMLFSVRSLQLRAGRSSGWAAGYLSALVIGDEVETMRRLAGQMDRVCLIGASVLCARYEQALAQAGTSTARLDGEACVLKGMELLNVER